MNKTQKQLAKNAAEFAVGWQIFKAGRRMSKMRKEDKTMQEEIKNNSVATSYEYVFHEVAVQKVLATTAGLVGIILMNGIIVDETLLAAAKDVIDTMQQALNPDQVDLPAQTEEN